MLTKVKKIALGAMLAGWTVAAQAQLVYTAGHGDIGVSYTPGATTFEARWGVDAGATVNGALITSHQDYAPSELVAQTTATSLTPGSSSTWLGVAGSTSVYRLGSESYPPNLGFNSSGAGNSSSWENDTLNITLSGWSGPGEVALRSGSAAGAVTLFSTYAPSSTDDNNNWAFDMGQGHVHLVWYFSQPGYYELTFDWSGTYLGEDEPLSVTGSGTYGFYAGAIPEPGTWALLGLGFGVLLWTQRRRLGVS